MAEVAARVHRRCRACGREMTAIERWHDCREVRLLVAFSNARQKEAENAPNGN